MQLCYISQKEKNSFCISNVIKMLIGSWGPTLPRGTKSSYWLMREGETFSSVG